MAKKYSIPLIFLLVIVSKLQAHIEPPKSQTERRKIQQQHEKYTAAKVSHVKATQQNASEAAYLLAKWTYDAQGRETKIVMYEKDGSIKTLTTQTYDQHGNLILDADLNENSKILEMNILEYNDQHLIRRVVSYDSDLKISGILEYSYLTDTVIATKYDANFALKYNIVYVYQKDKNTEAIQRNADGNLMIRTRNHYDNNGLRIRKDVFDANDELDFYYTYSYTPSGDYSIIYKYDKSGKLSRLDRYTYNEKGLQKELAITDGEGGHVMRRDFTYLYFGDDD